eukprot:ANDGO_07819.mRNA.1 hypothetical protein
MQLSKTVVREQELRVRTVASEKKRLVDAHLVAEEQMLVANALLESQWKSAETLVAEMASQVDSAKAEKSALQIRVREAEVRAARVEAHVTFLRDVVAAIIVDSTDSRTALAGVLVKIADTAQAVILGDERWKQRRNNGNGSSGGGSGSFGDDERRGSNENASGSEEGMLETAFKRLVQREVAAERAVEQALRDRMCVAEAQTSSVEKVSVPSSPMSFVDVSAAVSIPSSPVNRSSELTISVPVSVPSSPTPSPGSASASVTLSISSSISVPASPSASPPASPTTTSTSSSSSMPSTPSSIGSSPPT